MIPPRLICRQGIIAPPAHRPFMSKEGLIGFEAAVDFVRDRVESMDNLSDVRGFLEKLGDAVTARKVQSIELEFLDL